MIVSRVVIFIDFNNFQTSFKNRFNTLPDWDTLNQKLLGLLSEHVLGKFSCNDYCVEHIGTWVCAGVDPRDPDQEGFVKWLDYLDRKDGYVVKYGRLNTFNQEKGVDTEIVCQLMMGAFNNHYDVAVLMSEDSDFLPVVNRVQDYFGKRVVQMGYSVSSILRAQCYAHIALERFDKDFKLIV